MANEPARRGASQIAEETISLQFKSWVQAQAARERSAEEKWEITGSQLDRILTATTAEEIDAADELESDIKVYQGRDLPGLEVRVPEQDFRYAESSDEFDAPLGIYIQFRATALNDMPNRGISKGEEILISTGAPLIIGKLRSYQANGLLPQEQRVTAVKTAKGNVLKIKTITSATVSGTVSK